jgi:hypothetical protein
LDPFATWFSFNYLPIWTNTIESHETNTNHTHLRISILEGKNTWPNLTVLATTRPLDSWIPMLSTPNSKITPDGRHEALTSSPIYIAHSTHTDLDLRILEQKHERTPHRNW